jgi:hypothetical protein
MKSHAVIWLRFRTLTALLVLSAGGPLARGDEPATPGPDDPLAEQLPVVARFTFEEGGLAGWDFTDAQAWRIAELPGGGQALEQHGASAYEPPVRSPFNMALAPELDLTDFDLTLRVKSTARDYGHRDLCIFLGYQDPSHFYYIHLGKEADPHAHSIFLVDDEPRVSIAEERTDGTPWTDGWHEVRVVRRVEDGRIQVYFDDMTRPVMSTHDTKFAHGRIGVGSFDDTGLFDDIVVRGRRAD